MIFMKRYIDKTFIFSLFFLLVLVFDVISINKYEDTWLVFLHIIVIIVGVASILFYIRLIEGESNVT